MEIFNSIQDYREKKYNGQFFSRPGLVVCNGVFHQGVGEMLRRMSSDCDCRTLVVTKGVQDFFMVDEFLEKLHPYNLDYVVFAPEFPEVVSFKVDSSFDRYARKSGFFYLQLFNIFKPKMFFLGQKDFLEAKLVSELILDFAYDITLEVIENVRDKDGVLYSASLTMIEDHYLKDVYALHRSLEFLNRMIQNGQREVIKLEKLIQEYVSSFTSFKLVSLIFLDAVNLSEVRFIDSDKRIFIQLEGKVNDITFIDNCLF